MYKRKWFEIETLLLKLIYLSYLKSIVTRRSRAYCGAPLSLSIVLWGTSKTIESKATPLLGIEDPGTRTHIDKFDNKS